MRIIAPRYARSWKKGGTTTALLIELRHYNRPDVFRLYVDTSSRPTVVEAPASTWNA
jgi:hypothetical protein